MHWSSNVSGTMDTDITSTAFIPWLNIKLISIHGKHNKTRQIFVIGPCSLQNIALWGQLCTTSHQVTTSPYGFENCMNDPSEINF